MKSPWLDKYQLRDFSAIQRHVALVAVVYSLLRVAQHDLDLRDQLQRQIEITLDGSVAFWRRAAQAHSLWPGPLQQRRCGPRPVPGASDDPIHAGAVCRT